MSITVIIFLPSLSVTSSVLAQGEDLLPAEDDLGAGTVTAMTTEPFWVSGKNFTTSFPRQWEKRTRVERAPDGAVKQVLDLMRCWLLK